MHIGSKHLTDFYSDTVTPKKCINGNGKTETCNVLERKKTRLNEQNYGLGLSHHNLIVGAYKNSLQKTSVYAARDFRYKFFYARVGLLTGYGLKIPLTIVHGVSIQFTPRYKLDINIIQETNRTPLTLGMSIIYKI